MNFKFKAKLLFEHTVSRNYFFIFKTRELRKEFLNNFEEMIKKYYNIE
jgi:hypothetical protein